MKNQKVILLILDGWGYREDPDNNAIIMSNPENFNKLTANDPSILLDASGEFVGLPDGQMGNSEVGHTNIGAGRVVYQDLVKITKSFNSGEAGDLEPFKSFVTKVKNGTKRMHMIGLISDGGVHSHIDHFKAAAAEAKKQGIDEIYIHAITDGRDTPPQSGIDYLADLEKWTKDNNTGVIADVCGRYYIMDRDKRWDRVQKAYEMLFNRKCSTAESVKEVMKKSYANKVTDEFVEPCAIKGIDGALKNGDGILFMNFRADRMREILSAMYNKDFDGFERGNKPELEILTITEYDSSITVPVMFKNDRLINIMGEVISRKGLKQLRIAETEKYAHVTYFFNGGREEPFENEERILIPSPREVATYDLKPEMSVQEVAEKFKTRFMKGDLDFVAMNFANPDMVGHTGILDAAIKACKAVDNMLGEIIKIADETGAILMVAADHGNSEQMWDYETNQPHTAHTTNPVRFIIHNCKCKFNTDRGKLADIAPTVLKIMGIDIPAEMTGKCLID